MKKWTLIAGVFIAVLFAKSALSEEPSNSAGDEALRVDRLAATAKLWAMVKFFHPYLAYRDIDWDEALVKAIPKINGAANAAQYSSAVTGMLDVLQDPLTRIVQSPPSPDAKSEPAQPNDASKKSGEQAAPSGLSGLLPDQLGIDRLVQPTFKFTDDKILVITISSLSNWDALSQQLKKAGEELSQAQAVVFDLRAGAQSLPYVFGLSGIARQLTTTPIKGPAVRTRFHSGYANEDRWSTGRYYSAFVTSDASMLAPAARAKDLPVIFLTNGQAGLPIDALTLAAAGKAMIVAEGLLSDEGHVPSTQIELPGGITVQVRLGELVFEDGTTSLVADAAAPENEGLDVALAYARDPEKPSSRRRPRLPPVSAPRRDSAYADMTYPAAEYRVLAAMRIWSVHHYFYPYKDLMGEDWDAVLQEFITKMEAASDAKEYILTIKEMLAHVHDSHAFSRSGLLQESFGASPPVALRWIEESPVVTAIIDDQVAKEAGIQRGDVILKIDGEDAQSRANWWLKYIAASTRQSQMGQAAFSILRGPEGTVLLTVRDRNGKEKEVKLPRTRKYSQLLGVKRKGDIMQMLPGNVGYVDLDRLTIAMVDLMFEKFKDAQAIIFDMRGYPPPGTVWAIAPRLTEKKNVHAARFERPLVMFSASPDRFDQSAKQIFYQTIPPTDKSAYKGRTVMLIDERAGSAAEHMGLFFEAANGTKFVGTHSAGVNGDITYFFVPSGIQVNMTGHNVSHADGRQLQRVGLVPDVEVKPTIEGIRRGRDEVLEKALEYLGVKLTEPLKDVGEAL